MHRGRRFRFPGLSILGGYRYIRGSSLLTSAVCPARADFPPNVHRPRQGRSGLARPVPAARHQRTPLACALACAGHVRGRPVRRHLRDRHDDADRPRRWADLRRTFGDPRHGGAVRGGCGGRHRGRHRGGLPVVARRGRCDDRRNRHIRLRPAWSRLPARGGARLAATRCAAVPGLRADPAPGRTCTVPAPAGERSGGAREPPRLSVCRRAGARHGDPRTAAARPRESPWRRGGACRQRVANAGHYQRLARCAAGAGRERAAPRSDFPGSRVAGRSAAFADRPTAA